MPNVLIRGLDDVVLAEIKQRAKEHRRSANTEIKMILETAVFGNGLRSLQLPHIVSIGGPAMDRDRIYDPDAPDGR